MYIHYSQNILYVKDFNFKNLNILESKQDFRDWSRINVIKFDLSYNVVSTTFSFKNLIFSTVMHPFLDLFQKIFRNSVKCILSQKYGF